MDKKYSLKVSKINFTDNTECWGCYKTGESLKFCSLIHEKKKINISICMDCYEKNESIKYVIV